jgi:hypothetical protein
MTCPNAYWSTSVSADGAAIAQALRRTPIYLDPAYEDALLKARREQIVKQIRRSPVPVYVILVPIVTGSTWQSSEQVTTVVQSHLGRNGAYITLDADFGDVFDVVMWGGTDEQRRSANDRRLGGLVREGAVPDARRPARPVRRPDRDR